MFRMAIRESPGPDKGYGDGTFTNDGCPVEMYAAMPPDVDTAHIVHSAISPGHAVLELGCGAGRTAESLSELGHAVTGIDSSQEMLDKLTHTRPIHSDIKSLELTERFDAVLLASTLINTADPQERTEFLRVARAHTKDNGILVLERHAPSWRPVEDSKSTMGPVRFNCATSHGTTRRSCRRRSSTVWADKRRGRTSPPRSSTTSRLTPA